MSQPALSRVVEHLRQVVGAPEATVTDAQLLERFLHGRDQVAFELLVRRHERLVLGVCRRVLRNLDDADDAFQATFLLLVRKAASIGKREALAAWLHQVAYRVALRANGDARKRAKRETTDGDPSALPSRESDPATTTLHDLGPVLDQELSRLPEKYRAVVALCYLEGCTYEEAAQRLGCPRGTVSIWLTRARQLLRSRLGRRGVTLSAVGVGALLGKSVMAAPVAVTVQAALQWSVGGAAAVSTRAIVLAEGVLRTMFLTKIQFAAAVLLALALVTGGVLSWPSWAADGKSPPVLLPLPNADQGDPPPLGPGPDPGGAPGGTAAPTWQEVLRIEGHGDTVMSVGCSPDAKRLVTGSLDGPVRVWDVKTGKNLMQLDTPRGEKVYGVAFSPDGTRLVSVGGLRGLPGKARIWDAYNAAAVAQFEAGDDLATSVAFSPDGKMLVVGNRDKGVRAYTAAEHNILWSLNLDAGVFGIAFSPDAQRVAAVGGEEMVKDDNPAGPMQVLDASTGKIVSSPKGHSNTVSAAAFSPDGKLLASGSFDKTVRLWDVATGKEVRQFHGHNQVVRTVAFSPDGRVLASGGFDSTVRLWDLATGKEMAVLPVEKGVMSVVFSPDGRFLVVASGDLVRVYQSKAGVGGKLPGPGVAAGPDRFDALLKDLLDRQRSDEQILESLFLAMLGRLPSDVEKKFGMEHVSKSKDRREAFADLLFQLTNTKEFRTHAEALMERVKQMPVK